MPQDQSTRSIPTAEFFTDTWSIYEQILRENYMFHDEIYRDIEALLAELFAEQPISILDLGCGDASYLARALRGRTITRYRGVDLSTTALAAASTNLGSTGATLELVEGDLLEGLQSAEGEFDLIFSSFALHHLPTDRKGVFFEAASGQLNTNGMLILVDVMRDEEEDLPLYLEHYCDWLRKDWTRLPEVALDLVCDHIVNNDLPETVSILNRLAKQAGFDSQRELNDYRWHRTLCFDIRRA